MTVVRCLLCASFWYASAKWLSAWPAEIPVSWLDRSFIPLSKIITRACYQATDWLCVFSLWNSPTPRDKRAAAAERTPLDAVNHGHVTVSARDVVTWSDDDARRQAVDWQLLKLRQLDDDDDDDDCGDDGRCGWSDRWRCASMCDESCRYTARSRWDWSYCWRSTASSLHRQHTAVNHRIEASGFCQYKWLWTLSVSGIFYRAPTLYGSH